MALLISELGDEWVGQRFLNPTAVYVLKTYKHAIISVVMACFDVSLTELQYWNFTDFKDNRTLQTESSRMMSIDN